MEQDRVPGMTAVVHEPGAASALRIETVSQPIVGHDELLIRVAATAVNRADLLQRQGKYPPPPGASEILGLECSGIVDQVGADVSDWQVGDRVMALLPGGGYAERAVVDAGSAMPVPHSLDLVAAAALPEAVLTVFLTVFELASLDAGESLLVHGGGSGIGTTAITLARLAGARVAVTAGSDWKCARCRGLGADLAVNYREQDFAEKVAAWTDGRGVDVILDSIGAPYLARNLACLAMDGRLVEIATMGGGTGELDLRTVLRKRLTVIGSTLRARPAARKATLVRAFLARFAEDLTAGRIQPVVDRVLPLEAAEEAHRVVAASEHFGKVVLRVDS